MPVNLSTPIQVTINTVFIDIKNQSIVLNLTKGYTDTNGNYNLLNAFNETIPATEVATIFALMGDSSTTIYDTAKNALYNYLISINVIAGTIV